MGGRCREKIGRKLEVGRWGADDSSKKMDVGREE